MNDKNEILDENIKVERLPLWKNVLKNMRDDGLAYGKVWPASYFEAWLMCEHNSREFDFAMLSIKSQIETEDGYYLQSSNDGNLWSIPSAADHETVCERFDRNVKSFAIRAVLLRDSTLANPTAQLTDQERAKMEKRMEIAGNRLALLNKTATITRAIKKRSPKLLDNSKP